MTAQTVAGPGVCVSSDDAPGRRDVAGNALGGEKAWSFTTITTVNAAPMASAVESGSLRGGTFSRLASDDNLYHDVNSTTSGTRVSAWYARFPGVSNDLRSLRVKLQGPELAHLRPNGLRVPLDHEQLGGARFPLGTTEALIDRTASGAPGDYVRGTSGDGDVHLRVRCSTARRRVAHGRGPTARMGELMLALSHSLG